MRQTTVRRQTGGTALRTLDARSYDSFPPTTTMSRHCAQRPAKAANDQALRTTALQDFSLKSQDAMPEISAYKRRLIGLQNFL